jgi:cysteine desulfurase
MPAPSDVLYLDHAATTPMRPEARAAMEPFLAESYGNPSGVHGVSRRAKDAVEDARERAAGIIGADHPLDIVFTGGGTEADNLAIAGRALAAGGGIVTSAVEHEAVLETAAFLERLGRSVTVVGVDAAGVVDPAAVADAVSVETAVVSVMSSNNETGIRQPIEAIAKAARDVGGSEVLVHTDAVQSFVSEDVTVAGLGVDMVSLSAHKFGGPQGVGLLHVRRSVELEPVLHGGGQELGRRSGTHNVAGIVGMVAAMEAAVEDRARFREDVGSARDSFEDVLSAAIPDLVVTAPRQDRLVQHSHVRIPGVTAETLLIRLDGVGVAAAAGSACHSGAIEVSHVLTAMGLGVDEARESVRFSFGWTSDPGDGAEAARRVAACVEALR